VRFRAQVDSLCVSERDFPADYHLFSIWVQGRWRYTCRVQVGLAMCCDYNPTSKCRGHVGLKFDITSTAAATRQHDLAPWHWLLSQCERVIMNFAADYNCPNEGYLYICIGSGSIIDLFFSNECVKIPTSSIRMCLLMHTSILCLWGLQSALCESRPIFINE